MRITPQVYVRGSVAAAELYCAAFGAEPGLELKDEQGRYAHCELFVDGALLLALSEAPDDCAPAPTGGWQIMAFNVDQLGTEQAVEHAYRLLIQGGTIIDPLGPCPWSSCCANLIDRFGVFWWISI